MEVNSSQILKGTLESCILSLINKRDMYGYEILEELYKYNLDMVAKGTIYPLLLKLEKENLIEGYFTESNDGPPRKYYKITNDGKIYIEEFRDIWRKISKSINDIIK